MLVKLLNGLLVTIMSFFGLGATAQEAAPTPEQKQIAVAEQGNNDNVQALIDAAHAEAGYEFISVRYDGDTANIALNPKTYNPEKDDVTFEAVSQLLQEKGYQVTAVL
ncbi:MULTISPECIES: malonyl-CoA-ACP transacylase [Corynebacterium]|uniref:Malonyl-CoA-ACP transacylase n=1 Tax=Corynebacterium yonathiae TaxID=2913504 RepID=A0A9X3RL19_9CORY|nr:MULTISPECIES: malonyl-CoA-ACP transacylase [Corynebacterium]MCZ9295955.1 malonyl-CoA-ACP transacylase [Corynebacterium yonathiae]MDK2583149.1 malonyl-CoA-ACP transacylase [Corynebacterium sp. BWA136]MDK8480643.1 malonyl-CoA-ACP transacylase [Corynebacterium marquesiae]